MRSDTLRALREQVREILTCRNGASHYCPNCDNSIHADKILALLDAAARAPQDSPVLAFQAWAERYTKDRGPLTQDQYFLAQQAFYAAHPGEGPTSTLMAAARAPQEPAPDAAIDCPLCGVTVAMVSSATLSLALWQHVNWNCPKALAEAPRAETRRHARSCPAYGNYQPPYEECDCGAESSGLPAAPEQP